VKAMEKYPINILGHPTSRLLNEREPININLEKIFTVAKNNNVFLEINGSPSRMDLAGEQIKSMLDKGCKGAISTDAHDKNHLLYYHLGVLSARRGWAEKKDILNCWPLPKIEKALQK
ncbi:MAG: DNA polymerase III, partial [Nanoarchaeota archaeon]|nr:DNA polymerase III [Nanoarchaeota archaeon]